MPFLTRDPFTCETLAVPITVLYPQFDHPAIEERYASWQTQMLLKAGVGADRLAFYDIDEKAADAVSDVSSEYVMVIVDPLLLPSPGLGPRLMEALAASGAAAAVPISNEASNPAQRSVPATPYLTLRELQEVQASLEERPQQLEQIDWDRSNPALFLCRTEYLRKNTFSLRHAIDGAPVAISRTDYIHRWNTMRGQGREDLLQRISLDAKNVLEFGCGEGTLGQALKKRQKCRVVGIELDRDAAAIAGKRIDDVYCADAREIVAILHDQFDWIVGGDIVEHLDEPWSFLADLRRIAAPGGHLLLSLPNIAHMSVVNDLLQGRFDYGYMGLTCVGHLRFFTRRSIEEMLSIAGWKVVEIAPQEGPETPGMGLADVLEKAGHSYAKADARATGYYVIAQNR